MLKKSNQKMNNSDIKLKKDETQINPDLKQENESKNDSNELNKEEINTNLNSELTKEKYLNMDIKISKSEFIEDEQNKYYIPICRESGCNGYLEFDFLIIKIFLLNITVTKIIITIVITYIMRLLKNFI